MKAATATAAALGIALAAGLTGYQIGRSSAPAAATESKAPTGQESSQRRPATTTGFRKSDIPAFRARLAAETDPLVRFRDALRHMEDWVNADPADALAWLLEQPRSERRDEVIQLALAQYAEINPKSAAAWAQANLKGDQLNNNLLLIVEEWAVQNGTEAADWLNSLPPSDERDGALEGTFFTWAANHPEAAVAYLGKNPGEGEMAAVLRLATYAGWAKSDPENAVSASLESSRQHNDPAQFANTLANWATVDLPASSDWLLANLPDGPQRRAALGELAGMYADQSPKAGLAWLERLRPGTERTEAANAFAAEWASGDPAAAAAWAAKQPADTITPDTIAAIAHNFALQDGDAFDKWRATLPAGPLKHTADQLATHTEQEDDGEE